MKRAPLEELIDWSDERLLAAYRDLARSDLDEDGRAFFIDVISVRNDRSCHKAQREWLDRSLGYALRSRRPA